MSRWFRFYDDAINDPKILRLSDAMFKAWVTLLCLASKNDGILPKTNDIALVLRMKPAKAAEWLTLLTTYQLLDCAEDGTFRPHNWDGRQFKSDTKDETAAERMRRYRSLRRNGRNGDARVTVPRTDTEADNRTEQKKEPRAVALDDDWPQDFGDVFWQAYPRKTEKLSAMKKLGSLRKSRLVTFVDLMAGVKRYAAANTDPQFTKHPTTWLNAGCWADETHPGATNGQRTGNTRTSGHDAILAVAARKARELDRNDAMAGGAGAAGFAGGDGVDRSGSGRDPNSADAGQRDHHGLQPDSQRIREGEVIPPDKNAAGIPRGREFV